MHSDVIARPLTRFVEMPFNTARWHALPLRAVFCPCLGKNGLQVTSCIRIGICKCQPLEKGLLPPELPESRRSRRMPLALMLAVPLRRLVHPPAIGWDPKVACSRVPVGNEPGPRAWSAPTTRLVGTPFKTARWHAL